jgi:release factor glutamine methyltransferase
MSTARTEDDPWTVSRLLEWTRTFFQQHGVESPRLCAEILLAHAMGCERIELYTRHQSVPGENVLARFRAAVKEAAAGRPIAHLTGAKEFFSLEFKVTPDVLIPRPETEVLVERVIHLVRHGGDEIRSILDVGTGSGCIAISLAKNLPHVALFACDVSGPAIEVARRNAQRHRVPDRITFRLGDLFEPWEPKRLFDVIVSNPPYVAESEAASLPVNVRDFEPHAALFAGADGLDLLRRLIGGAPRHLAPDGHLLTEIAYNQAVAVRGLLDETVWRDIVTYSDDLGHERVVHARHHADEQTQVA